VACRTALQARRLRPDAPPPDADLLPARDLGPEEAACERELQRVLDEEIGRLPAKYRRAVVLCYLQGRTNAEAAQHLGRPVGTVASWLTRARERLRVRLNRRGIGMTPALLGTLLAAERLWAAVPVTLVQSSYSCACALLSKQTVTISSNVLSIYRGVLKAMLRTRVIFLGTLFIGLIAAGIAVFNSHGAQDGIKLPFPGTVAGKQPPVKPDQPKQPPKVILPGDGGKTDLPKNPKKDDDKGQPVNVQSFHTIVLLGTGNVYVKQTGKESVSIKSDKNFAAAGSAKVVQGVLYLGAGPGIGGGFGGGFGGGGIAGGANPVPGGAVGFAGGFGGVNGMPAGFAGLGGAVGFGGMNPIPPGAGVPGFGGANPAQGGAGLLGGMNPAQPGGGAVGNGGAVGFAGVPGFGGVNPGPGGIGQLPGLGGLNNLIEYHIEVKTLKGLAIYGTGTMDVRDLDSKQLAVVVGGTGDLEVQGKADLLQVNVIGNGNFVGEYLKTQQCGVSHHGFGKATVHASKTLNATVTGIGTVEYVGSPQVQKSILGVGRVSPKQQK
jgi:hypothetical protein